MSWSESHERCFLPTSKIEEIKKLVAAGFSIRAIRERTGISTKAIQKYRRALLAEKPMTCTCDRPLGHNGVCRQRYGKTPRRRAYIERVRRQTPVQPPSAATPRWPFIPPGHPLRLPLLDAIDRAVPHAMPEHIRDDVCQELALAVLAGEIPEGDIRVHVGSILKRVYALIPMPYGTRSLDMPLGGKRLTLSETIASDTFHW